MSLLLLNKERLQQQVHCVKIPDQLTLMSPITDCTEQKKKKIFITRKAGLPENPEVNKCWPPKYNIYRQLQTTKLHIYYYWAFILDTTRYYEDESKVTHTQCQIQKRRSSATAEKQRVSCACLPIGCLTDRAMHRKPQNRRGCVIFWHSHALIQEVLAKNAFWHEIATQGHSRSFILQSFAGRQGVAYRHIILLAISLKFSKT